MALSKNNMVLNNGLVAPTTYIKVVAIRGNKNFIEAHFKAYLNKEIADADGVALAESFYTFVPDVSNDAPNYHKQSYDSIKNTDEYIGAIDV